MGFSLSDTVVAEGTEMRLEYKHHLEGNFCIAGEGEVVDLQTGTVHLLRPGSLYALDSNDEAGRELLAGVYETMVAALQTVL